MIESTTPTESMRHPAWRAVSDAQWSDWRWQLRNRVTTLTGLEPLVALTDAERAGIERRQGEFPMAITPHYLSLMRGPGCPVRRQGIPDVMETVREPWDLEDPLGEEEHSPVECLSHRYPDRALLYVTHNCPVYCRHCTRQRKVGDAHSAPSSAAIDAAFDYLVRTPQVRDVLISGGDPLSLSDARLVDIVSRLRAIPSVEIIRLCTRNPVTLPQRITDELVAALRPYHPLFVSTHFNHPNECSVESARCLERLADGGFVINNQSVLLAGINDDADVLAELSRWLLRHRCRPYYLFQCDQVVGTTHLRTGMEHALSVVDRLRGTLSGLGIPQYAIDLPGGGGKIVLSPDRLVRRDGSRLVFRDHRGVEFTFTDPGSVFAQRNLRSDGAAAFIAPASAPDPDEERATRSSVRLSIVRTTS